MDNTANFRQLATEELKGIAADIEMALFAAAMRNIHRELYGSRPDVEIRVLGWQDLNDETVVSGVRAETKTSYDPLPYQLSDDMKEKLARFREEDPQDRFDEDTKIDDPDLVNAYLVEYELSVDWVGYTWSPNWKDTPLPALYVLNEE